MDPGSRQDSNSKREKLCVNDSHCFTILGSLAFAIAIFAVGFSHAATPAPAGSGYHVIKTVPVGGDGGWDYVYVDSDARRVYVSHGTHVVVLDADTYAVVGDIPDTQGVHGIAIASDLGRGFISNGRSNNVTIFDLKTLKTHRQHVKTDANPDAIVYDPVTKRVFTFNGRGKNTTAINAADGTVPARSTLGGKPEFAVADGKGSIFVNNEDTSELIQLDAAETHRNSIAGRSRLASRLPASPWISRIAASFPFATKKSWPS